jgi:hypothetical protein
MSWFDSRQGQKIFLPSKVPRPALRPAEHPLGEHRELLPTGERMEREPDHSPLSSARFKNTWSHASTAPHVFMVCILLFVGFYNLNATISITGQPTSKSYTKCLGLQTARKLKIFHISPKHVDSGSGNVLPLL